MTVAHTLGGPFGLTSFQGWAKQIMDILSSTLVGAPEQQTNQFPNTIWRIHSDASRRVHLRLGAAPDPRGLFYGAVSCVGAALDLTPQSGKRAVSLLNRARPASLVRDPTC